MADVDDARRQLEATLRRAKWTGWLTLLAGLVLGVVVLPLGIAVAVVGLILSVGAGFVARGLGAVCSAQPLAVVSPRGGPTPGP